MVNSNNKSSYCVGIRHPLSFLFKKSRLGLLMARILGEGRYLRPKGLSGSRDFLLFSSFSPLRLLLNRKWFHIPSIHIVYLADLTDGIRGGRRDHREARCYFLKRRRGDGGGFVQKMYRRTSSDTPGSWLMDSYVPKMWG